MPSWMSSAVSAVAGYAVSAFSAIAGSVGYIVVEKIVEIGFSYLRNRMLPRDSEAELKRLEMALPQIRDVMGIAEALKVKDPSLGAWFVQFRNAVDASEDVLDELEYRKLEDMVENRHEAGGSASGSKKKKRSCLINDGTLTRLRDAVRMLDEAAANVKHIHQRAAELGVRGISELQQETHNVLRRETTSFLTEMTVFGREVEKEQIIGWLKQPSQDRLSCYGIIGAGGLGKTTLAQLAYQEMSGSNIFDKKIWVCISTKFSVEQITQVILGELGESRCDGKPLNALQESLKEKIHSKKIFLVLDDIWNDDKRSDWEQLFAPLQFVQQGSKILFTTRMKSVADLLCHVINIESEPLVLQGLPMKELLQLFNSYAFRGFNPDNYENLQSIGNQMVKMLKGSPLAAKVIGSLLNSRMDHLYWRRVYDSGSLFNLGQAKDVTEVLKLSYYHLPADLQVCFRFCSIFPQDYKFEKNELIKMWMAVGFLQQQICCEERLEDIGDHYFNHLLKKSFFEYSPSYDGKIFYVMHDLMHELAQNVSNGECCRLVPDDKLVVIPSSVRHIFVHENVIQRISHLENLHSLIIETSDMDMGVNTDPFVLPSKLNKKSLRLLKIYTHRGCQLSEEISCLMHLHYLSIYRRFTQTKNKFVFPTSIHKLYNLQVLEFIAEFPYVSDLEIETERMSNLVRLRCLRLPIKIMETIPGVHRLTSLQELKFSVGQDSDHCISELHTLNNLRKLSIYKIENIEDPAEAKSANLLGKKNLRSLSLNWTSESYPDNSEQIIDSLKPNPNLMELEIWDYKGQRAPNWMDDSPPLNLSVLRLFDCPIWKDQIFSCQMSNLKILVISNCPNLNKLSNMPLSLMELQIRKVGLTSLPNLCQKSYSNTGAMVSQKLSLRIVELIECLNLVSLDGFLQQGDVDLQAIEELTIIRCKKLMYMPTQGFEKLTSLKCLSIQYCPNLTRFPNLPYSVSKLDIWNVVVSVLPEYNTSLDSSVGPSTSALKSSLSEVSISGCPNLTSLNGFLQQEYIDFQSLQSLYICNCRNLLQLPTNAFGKFVALKYLTIEDCPMLLAIDNQSNLLPVTLENLDIINCGELDVQLLESASHLTALAYLSIQNNANINHIPCSGNAFRSLCSLSISGCDKLVKSSSREPAHSVNLQKSNLASSKINMLSVDHLSLLLIEPLRSLKLVSELTIKNWSGMDAFPEQWLLQNKITLRSLIIDEARTLKSLPATIARFTALTVLIISRCEFLEEIQELPVSLRILTIRDVWSLKSLPATIAGLTGLEKLEIMGADLLEELPELPSSLRILRIEEACNLTSLPTTMSSLTVLEELTITEADSLYEIPALPRSLKIKSISRSHSTELCA